MADTTLTAVPVSFYQGDTLALLVSLSDYPANEGWALSYSFRGGGSSIDLTSVASGSSHLVSVAATVTTDWLPGNYSGIGKVTDGTTVITVWRGTLQILADLSEEAENYDPRSHAQKCLDAINAVMEGKATKDVLQTTIAGQSVGRMTWTELMSAKAYYQDLVDKERTAIDAANGRGGGNQILVRFGKAL